MSHFFTIVAVPEGTEDIRAYVANKLEPYSENLEVPGYEEECWCLNRIPRNDAYSQMNELCPIDEVRVLVRAMDESGLKGEATAFWRLFWEWRDLRAQMYIDNDPRLGMTDEDCEDCHGTGKYISTRNPNSKWDWWDFGGRYNGRIRNAYRADADGFNFDAEYRQLGENIVYAGEYELTDDTRPFAFVDLDGKWHERGEMGWFAVVADGKDKDVWMTEVEQLLVAPREQNALLVGVDLHI